MCGFPNIIKHFHRPKITINSIPYLHNLTSIEVLIEFQTKPVTDLETEGDTKSQTVPLTDLIKLLIDTLLPNSMVIYVNS